MTVEYDECCAYCRLPLSNAAGRVPTNSVFTADQAVGSVTPQAAAYCCFGCRFAAAIAAENGTEGQVRWTLTRLGLAIFFSMNVMVFTLAMWSQDVYADSLATQRGVLLMELYRYLCLIFTTPVLLLLGIPLLQNAWDDLLCRRITTDLLIVIGVAAAFAYSVVAVFRGEPHVYFEVACMVLVAVTLGRWLEAAGKQRTTQALRSLESLLPTTVRVLEQKDQPGKTLWNTEPIKFCESNIPLEAVEVGHILRVLPGERIPVDGVIRRGQAAIDQQIVTGESRAVIKEPHDEVFAGTLNTDGDLLIEVLQPQHAGVLRRIIDAVQKAAMAKGRLQNMADRIAAWFVPLVIVVAGGTFVAHFLAAGLDAGLMAALAVLLIACPCALGIATPMAIHAALGRAVREGVLFRTGDMMEQLAQVQVICFDKTGTLTTGDPDVDQFVIEDAADRSDVLQVAATLAAASTHGLSASVRRFAELYDSAPLADISNVKTSPGRGLSGHVPDIKHTGFLGSWRYMVECGLMAPPAIEQAIRDFYSQGKPVVCVGWDGRVRAVFGFREQLRDVAGEVLTTLRNRGLTVTLLTGDHATQAAVIARELGVDVKAELLPEGKLAAIEQLRQQHGLVAMIGDGINDAPALARADVGIAMGCGADVSREAAEVCLLGNDLRQIPWAIDFARQTTRTMRQNLAWAFGYNSVGILFAVTGWLNPIWAAVAMVASSLFVVTNSLRLASTASSPANEVASHASSLTNHLTVRSSSLASTS